MLEIDGTLIVAMISFVIFMFIMNIVFYQPILKIMQERKSYLAENSRESFEAEKKARELIEERISELKSARVEAAEIINSGTERLKFEHKEKISSLASQIETEDLKRSEGLVLQVQDAKNSLSGTTDELAEAVTMKLLGGLNA